MGIDMEARITRVRMCAPREGWRDEFPLTQAERMLNLPNPAWVIDDARFEFIDGKIRRISGRRGGEEGR